MALLRRAINNLSESLPLFILSKDDFQTNICFQAKCKERNEILMLVYSFIYGSFMNLRICYYIELFCLPKIQKQYNLSHSLKTNISTRYRNGQTQRDQQLSALHESTTHGRFVRNNKSSLNSLSSKARLTTPSTRSCFLFGSTKIYSNQLLFFIF